MVEIRLEDMLYLPASDSNLPHVTPAMVLDCLEGYDVLTPLPEGRRIFRWFAAFSSDADEFPVLPTLPDASVLFACDSRNALDFLAQRPSAFALVLLEPDQLLAPFEPYLDRILVVARDERSSSLAFLLQSFFIKILLWENDLEHIVVRDGSIAEMLDASTSILRNFIFVSDANFNVVARTAAVEPPDELHRGIVKNGCLTSHIIAEPRFRLPEKTFYTREASEITPYDRVSYPVHINHSYFGSISMACSAAPDTEGLRDLFRTLARYMTPLCERLWSKQAALNLPSYFFFIKLIEGESMEQDYLQAQMEMANLEAMGHFKLVMLDVDGDVEPDRATVVSRAATGLNGSDAYVFPYREKLLVLCYDQALDGRLSHRSTAEDLVERIYEPYGVVAAVSSVFTDLADLDLAYRQARIALEVAAAVDRERSSGADGAVERQGVYFFEDALLYYLVDPALRDRRFMDFIFDNSLVNVLYQDDLANGTSYTELLWAYLQTERNATAVANRLHMHRNTVLYHIEKIEKRFDFDLSSKTARDWLLLSFKQFFLKASESSLEDVFGASGAGEGAEGLPGAASSPSAPPA